MRTGPERPRREWAAALVVLAGATVDATEIRVPGDYPTIQAGVDAAVAGDTVLVAPGLYADSEIRIIEGFQRLACVYLRDGVNVRSEGGSSVTTIDMQGAVGFQANVIFGDSLYSNQTVVEGFTITGVIPGRSAVFCPDAGGYKMTFRDCVFRDLDGGSGTASAVNMARTDVDLIGCTFRNCVGGLATVYQLEGDMLVSGCVFEDCHRGIYANSGAPPYPSLFRLDVVDSEFRRCRPASGSGGAILTSNYDAGVRISNSTFIECQTPSAGGAVSLVSAVPSTIEDCVFRNNHTTVGAASGGALFLGFGAVVSGCTFYSNGSSHPQVAGTIRCDTGAFQFLNNVIASTTTGLAVQGVSGAVLTGGCNVFWDNPDGVGYPLTPTDQVADPQFCNPDSGIFTVTTASPCLPMNNPGCTQIGAFSAGCDPISVDAASWGQIKAGYRREPEEGAKP